MSVSLDSYPSAVVLAGNGVHYTLGGNDVETVGVLAILEIEITTIPIADDTITIPWNSNEVTFTFKASPDDSGIQLSLKGALAWDEWLDLLIEELSANYSINEYFTITSAYPALNAIWLTKKEAGKDLLMGTTSKTGTIVISLDGSSGGDEDLYEFYKLSLQILDSSALKLGEDLKPLNTDGQAKFNVAKYCTPELSSTFTKEEDIGSSLLREDLNICKLFDVKYSEYYGETPEYKKVFEAANSVAVINGGVSKWQQALWNEASYSFLNWIKYEKHFLTFRPRGGKVAYLSHQRLYFLNIEAAMTAISMVVTANWTDGTSTTGQIVDTIATTRAFAVYELICSPEKIRDEFPAGKTLSSFSVGLTNFGTGAALSESFLFVIDHNSYNNNRFFMINNSLDGWDCLRTTGETKKNGEYQKQLFSKFLDEDFTTMDHEEESDRALENISYNVDSGVLDNREEANYWRELMMSGKVYEIVRGKYIPVRIVSNKAEIYKDDDYNYHIAFTVEHAYTNEYFSNIQELIDAEGNYFGDELGAGFFTAEEYRGILQQNSNTFN